MNSFILLSVTMGGLNLAFVLYMLRHAEIDIHITLPWLLVYLILFGAIIGGYSLWTASRITSPLNKISEAIRQMRQGSYAQRLEMAGSYEFTIIQQQFNDMAAQLEQAQANNRQLEETKKQMLADLSHDLRSPIASIQGYARHCTLAW
ncbi:HAMP domain-containing protein [Paenibacillus lacisoli]|nr:HAMP domain-containing protein [Paenibacillus sp. JX-17]